MISICSVIVALTPTPTDDKLWAKVYKYLEVLALAIGKQRIRILCWINKYKREEINYGICYSRAL